jgi:hypothetical protein
LLSRLQALLNVDEASASPAKQAELAAPVVTPVDAKLAQCEKVIGVVGKLVGLFKDRMLLLHAAGQEARVLPLRPLDLNPRFQLQVNLIADLLRQNREAATLVGSAVMRYLEAPADLERLNALIARRRVDDLHVEQIKGKYLFLTKINVYFKDFPLLYQLFKPAQKPGAPAAVEPETLGPTPIRAASGTLNAGRSTAPLQLKDLDLDAARRSLSGETDHLSLSANRGTGMIETERLVIQGKKLLAGLDMRMVILKVACDQVLRNQGQTKSGSAALLPLPAQETARNVAAVLTEEPQHLERARELIGVYNEVKNALNQRPLRDPPRVKHMLTTITTLPYQFKGNALLEQLFLGRKQLAT